MSGVEFLKIILAKQNIFQNKVKAVMPPNTK